MSRLPPCDHDECGPSHCKHVGKANEQRLVGCDALVSLSWTYGRTKRRHTAYDDQGRERFWIVSCAPRFGFQGKHGYRLLYGPDKQGNPGGHIQHSKFVKLLKGVANQKANEKLSRKADQL